MTVTCTGLFTEGAILKDRGNTGEWIFLKRFCHRPILEVLCTVRHLLLFHRMQNHVYNYRILFQLDTMFENLLRKDDLENILL